MARYDDFDIERLLETVNGFPTPEVLLFGDFGPPRPKSFLVDGFLGADEASVVYAPPDNAKTSVAIDLSCHIACGKDWNGRRVEKSGVLYIALERRDQVLRRIQAFVKHHEVPTAGPDFPFNLAVSSDTMDLRKENSLLALWLRARWELFEDDSGDRPELGLVVLDTFSRAIGDGSDSDEKDMRAVAAEIERFRRDTGCHVMLVHHTPVSDDTRMRGHGALLAAVDLTISVKKSRDGHVTARTVKANDLADRPRFDFTMQSIVVHTDAGGRDTTASVMIPATAPAADTDGEEGAPAIEPLSPACAEVLGALQGLLTAANDSVHVEAWRDAAYQRAGSLTPSGKRKRFTRSVEVLTERGIVSVNENHCRFIGRDSGTRGTRDTF